MSTLDDFFGSNESQFLSCRDCNTTTGLIGHGAYDIGTERYTYYLCPNCTKIEDAALKQSKSNPYNYNALEDEMEDGAPPQE